MALKPDTGESGPASAAMGRSRRSRRTGVLLLAIAAAAAITAVAVSAAGGQPAPAARGSGAPPATGVPAPGSASASGAVPASGAGSGPAPVPLPAGWQLAFASDFSGATLAAGTWAECYPWEASPRGCTNFGNRDELEWYLPAQVRVANGVLALTAQRAPTSGYAADGSPKTYSCRSGMVTTYPGLRFQYGLVQVTARIPFGTGLWPAIWLAPADWSWPPEIDVLEHWGTDAASRATLHPRTGPPQQAEASLPGADQGWHDYTLYWTQSRLTVYYDGRPVFSTTQGIPRQQMYLLLDLANDSAAAGSCTGTMYVKSVRVWEPAQPAASR